MNDQKAGASPYAATASQVVVPKNCVAKGSALADGKRSEGVAIFSVELRDLVGDAFVGACRVQVRVACNGMPVECKQRDQQNGTHTVEFLRSLIGSYSAEVLVNDEPIMGSPFAFNVSERKDVLAGRVVAAPVVAEKASEEVDMEEKQQQEARRQREREEEEEKERARRQKEREEEEEEEERQRQRRREARAREEEEERERERRQDEERRRQREQAEAEERAEEERRREQRRRRDLELEEEEKRREEEELRKAEEAERARLERKERERAPVEVAKSYVYDEVLMGEVGEEGENRAASESPRRDDGDSRVLSWEEKMAREDREADARRLRIEKARQDSEGRSALPAQVQLAAASEGKTKTPAGKGNNNREVTPAGQVPETGGVVLKYAEIKGRKKHFLYSDEVNCNHLEAYLSAEEFEKVFGMDKTEFYGKSLWRRAELLKKVNLF